MVDVIYDDPLMVYIRRKSITAIVKWTTVGPNFHFVE